MCFFAGKLYACEKSSKRAEAQAEKILQEYIQEFGDVSFLKKIKVCIGRKKFHEIKNGSQIRAFYDRKDQIIYLRKFHFADIRHEVLHAYIDKKAGNLPYSVSENLVVSLMQDLTNCHFTPAEKKQLDNFDPLEWFKNEKPLPSCADYYIARKFIGK